MNSKLTSRFGNKSVSNENALFPFHQVALDFIRHIGRSLDEDGELEDLVPEVTKYVMEGTQAGNKFSLPYWAFSKFDTVSWINLKAVGLSPHLGQVQ